jgi:hypothetical protein
MLKKGIILFPPNAIVNTSSLPWYNEFSKCATRGLAIKRKMEDALPLWSIRPIK